MRNNKALFVAILGLASALTHQAGAATQSVTANIAFDTPLALSKTADIDFGTVKAGTSSTYTITTAGAVSATGSGSFVFGSPHAASITISGSSTQLMNISVGGYTANNGVTPSNATCAYNGGSSGSCNITGAAAPGTGKTLLVGVDAAADGTQAGGTSATPSFTITAVYQ